MRLREYIDKSLEQEDPKGLLLRAIDSVTSVEDMDKVAALIASLSQNMDNEDIIFVKAHFDKVWVNFQGELRKVKGGTNSPDLASNAKGT